MAITMLNDNARLPVIGKVRLGIRKETDRGTEYPESVPHFVLHDAPEIAKAYGDAPTEFDAFFLTDDIEDAIPNWYKWYSGGKRDKHGNIVGGELQCYGTGPAGKNPDGSYMPGVAYHMAKRDPQTRIVPERQCLGDKCPDYKGANGKVQCGPAMTVNVMVPLASLFGIFTIDTKSITSISRFVSQVSLIKEQFGKLRGIPFKIYRDPVSLPVPDKPGQKKTHYILSIKPNEEFVAQRGKEVTAKIAHIINSDIMGPSAVDRIGAPMEDHYAITHDETQTVEQKVATAAEVAELPEMVALFEELATLKKVKLTPQNRLLTARKFEKEKDLPAALKKYLEDQIATAKAAVKPEPAPQTPAPKEPNPPQSAPLEPEVLPAEKPEQKAAPASQPAPDVNGLI